METTKTNEDWNTPQNNIPYFKVDPIVVLVLGIITCGLYLIYWNIKMAEVLNAVNNTKELFEKNLKKLVDSRINMAFNPLLEIHYDAIAKTKRAMLLFILNIRNSLQAYFS